MNDREREALLFITAHIEREGFAPTVREIAAALATQPSKALAAVVALEESGHIERPKGPNGLAIARAMRVRQQPQAA